MKLFMLAGLAVAICGCPALCQDVPADTAALLREWGRYCLNDLQGKVVLTDGVWLSRVDIDGDSAADFIYDGSGVGCEKDGRFLGTHSAAVGPILQVVMSTSTGSVEVFQQAIRAVEIDRHDGFGVIAYDGAGVGSIYRVAAGKMIEMLERPAGGQRVYMHDGDNARLLEPRVPDAVVATLLKSDDLGSEGALYLDPSNFPPPIAEAISNWKRYCEEIQGFEAVFSKDFITNVDIDQDGDKDIILDGHEKMCVRGASGEVSDRGSGNGNSIEIYTVAKRGMSGERFDNIRRGRVIEWKGFAVFVYEATTGVRHVVQLKGGKLASLKAEPRGGKVVYITQEKTR
ncbi:hypothetical protein ACQKKX_13245 [Neorhizobium sp. NPDC001467]|uniref:hypothetical protein n=1 Tax=Neorhizobium sp. NPDC001467 TaxID=3390595 RepID=UPI003CFDA36E